MSYFFVSSGDGNDADAGTDMDLAWALFEKAHESGGLSAGDVVIVRRTHSETPVSDAVVAYDGSPENPLYSIGWPRAAIPNTTITEGDFTNGSKIIDNVVGITPNRSKHSNRYITAPDGKQYHITAILWESGLDGIGVGDGFAVGDILTNVTQTKKGKVWAAAGTETTDTLQYVRDSATAWVNNDNVTSDGGGDGEVDVGGETAVGFLLSQEYAGTTVTGVTGKFQIEADPDYDFLNFSDTFTAATSDVVTIGSAHPYRTGDCVRVVNSGGALPAGLAADTDYYVIYLTTTTIKLASSLSNANSGTAVDITGTGTGTHTIATIEDSTWTIKKSAYNADADDVPIIDFNDGAVQFTYSLDNYHFLKNMEFKDCGDTNGFFSLEHAGAMSFEGCLFKQTASNSQFMRERRAESFYRRCLFEGSGAGTAQKCLDLEKGIHYFTDCAIFNMGDWGGQLENSKIVSKRLNVGIEMANGDDDFDLFNNSFIEGTDLALGGTNGDVSLESTYTSRDDHVTILNDQKVLGAWKKWFKGGTIERAAVTGETPNKKVSDYVIKINPNTSGLEFFDDWAIEVFRHTFEADNSSKTYKYWLYNDMGKALNLHPKDDIWLKVEYVDSYDDASEYTFAEVFSSEISIADAADADDWDYLQVTCQPAIASKVIITCYVSTYAAATADIFIDPAVVIS